MKKFFAILTVAILCVAMAVPAFAADAISSPENNVDDIIISAVDKDGKDADVKATIDDAAAEAKKELGEDGKLADVIGKPAENKYTVKNVVSLTFADGTSFPVSIKLAASGVKEGDTVYILCKTADGWKTISAKAEKDAVSFDATANGVYAIVVDAASAPSSPTTGYAGVVAMISVLGLISLAGAAYATKRCF